MDKRDRTLDRYIWIDIETTGLDNITHNILEIALFVSDNHLNVLSDEYEWVVDVDKTVLDKMDDFVTEMHTDTGLLEKIKSGKGKKLEVIEEEIIEIINRYKVEGGKVMIAGDGIHFDFRFI